MSANISLFVGATKYEYLTNAPLDLAKADYLNFLCEAGMEGREERVPVAVDLESRRS